MLCVVDYNEKVIILENLRNNQDFRIFTAQIRLILGTVHSRKKKVGDIETSAKENRNI